MTSPSPSPGPVPLPLPEPVQRLSLRIAAALEQVAPGAELYLVGGFVRDLLLGGSVGHDLDYATSAAPRQTQRALKAAHGKVFTIGEKFGTIGAVFDPDPAISAQHAPTASAEQTPAASAQHAPAASAEQTPAASAQQTPAASAEPSPAASAEQIPAASAEQTPAASVEQSPAASVEHGPPASAEESPAASAEQSPAASVEPSPAATNVEHRPAGSLEPSLAGNSVEHGPAGRLQVEITTYRAEAYEPGSRKPRVAFRGKLTDDLARRDFTINAIALDPRTGELADPFDGRADLERGLIRAVGTPSERFREDPLRLLRAVRFATRLGFEIEPTTASAIRAHAPELARISRERVRDELDKTLLGPAPARAIDLLCDLGLAEFSLPDLLKLRGMQQDDMSTTGRHKDVFSHTLQVLDRTPPRLALRWAAVLHDIAKPATKRVEHGKVTFHGHDHKGERMARRILAELHEPGEFVDRVARLVGLHLRANAYAGAWTDSAVRRFVLEVGDELLEDLLALSRADVTTARVERRAAIARSVAELEERITALRQQEDIARIASPLDGLELMQLFDRGPGAWIQRIKDELRELVIDGELAAGDKDAAIPIARALYARLNASE